MKSFIKGLWSRTKTEPEARVLDHPRALQIGDFLQMSDSYGLPEYLRDEVFEVTAITTWQFEHEFETTFSLQSKNNDSIDLTIDGDAGRESASFSIEIPRATVEQLFDTDEFSSIFDEESPATLNTMAKLDIGGWLSDQYHQTSCGERGFFYQKDCRDAGPSKFEGDGEPFDYYAMASTDESQAVEIAVYAGGETEVSLVLHRSISDIRELWPAA
jgi:hypothetical protein